MYRNSAAAGILFRLQMWFTYNIKVRAHEYFLFARRAKIYSGSIRIVYDFTESKWKENVGNVHIVDILVCFYEVLCGNCWAIW